MDVWQTRFGVMDLELEVGQVNTVMGTMGTFEQREANLTRDEVYLPRLLTSILQTISNTVNTTIGANANSAQDLTPCENVADLTKLFPGKISPD